MVLRLSIEHLLFDEFLPVLRSPGAATVQKL